MCHKNIKTSDVFFQAVNKPTLVFGRDSASDLAGEAYNGCRLRGPKSVHLGNGLPLLALRYIVSLQSVGHFKFLTAAGEDFPVSGGI